jgi:hypothetical protein
MGEKNWVRDSRTRHRAPVQLGSSVTIPLPLPHASSDWIGAWCRVRESWTYFFFPEHDAPMPPRDFWLVGSVVDAIPFCSRRMNMIL